MRLLIEKNFINGEWVSGSATIDVKNPATGDTIGAVPEMGKEEVGRAIDAAHQAQSAWAATTAYERAELMFKWIALIRENKNELAKILVMESGKPFAEALTEVEPSNLQWNAEEAKRIYGRSIPAGQANRDIVTIMQPVGVCGMITPWNFPNAMITRKVGPALAAGCTVVLKPDHRTPFSALALAKLAEEAGFPKGVFNVVTGDAAEIGQILTGHDRIRKISFTGSTEVGRLLMGQVAPTVKKISLELGGNAPFIVFESAHIDAAIKGVMMAKIRNAGQTCVCPNRVYVHEKIHDAFVEKLLTAMKNLKVGNGMDEGVQVGPLIDEKGLEKVEGLVKRAVENGAKVLLGGKRHALGGSFFEPTILTHISSDMEISCKEIFGPVLPIQTFKTEDEVVAKANDTIFGLASYFYTNDLAQTHRVMKALEYGMIGVNNGLVSFSGAPFGGVKQSGLGREGGVEGIHEYLETKYIAVQG